MLLLLLNGFTICVVVGAFIWFIGIIEFLITELFDVVHVEVVGAESLSLNNPLLFCRLLTDDGDNGEPTLVDDDADDTKCDNTG